jgi:hypothetical protein
MAIQILYPSEQTRRKVISSYLAGQTAIAWQLRGAGGYFYNPAGTPNQFGLVPNVRSVLTAIGGNKILVMGASGLAATEGILTSTIAGMESDDYAAAQILGDVTFVGPTVG